MEDLYSATITIDQEQVLTVTFKDKVDVDVAEMERLVDVSLNLIGGKPFYLLVDARDIYSSMDHESRKYIAEHERYNQLNIAQAIVVNNMPIRLLASAYFKLYRHVNPVRIFSDMKEARKWLFTQTK